MIKPYAREGPAVPSATVIVLDDPPAALIRPGGSSDLSAAPKRGGGGDHLDTTRFVAQPRAAALAPEGPVLRVQVTVDEELIELPHDDPASLQDFIECLYLLHGWKSIRDVDEELRMMLKLREQPDEVALESGLPFGAPSGGVPAREGEESGPLGSPPPAPATREVLPGGVVLEAPPAARSATQEQLRMRQRYDALRRRVILVPTSQIQAWVLAFGSAFADLRETVLLKMQAFEREAGTLAVEMLTASREQVALQTDRYFRFPSRGSSSGSPRQVEAALGSPAKGHAVDAKKEAVIDLRARLKTLRPQAQAVADAKKAEEAFKERHFLEGPEEVGKDLERLGADIETKNAAYGKALVVESAEHPVLLRVDAETALKADTLDNKILGDVVFIRLQKTWQAAEGMIKLLEKNRPAKGVEKAEIRQGQLPETRVGGEAKASVWAYPRLLEKTFATLPPDDYAFLEVAIPNVRAALDGRRRADARFAIVAGIGLAGLQIGMIAVCPPAGIALDVALSAVDIAQSAEGYEKESDEALCVLDPREALREEEPSVVPLVFAIAGAAMVVL